MPSGDLISSLLKESADSEAVMKVSRQHVYVNPAVSFSLDIEKWPSSNHLLILFIKFNTSREIFEYISKNNITRSYHRSIRSFNIVT